MSNGIDAARNSIEQLFQEKNPSPRYELTGTEQVQTTNPFGSQFGDVVFEIVTLDCLVPFVITPEHELYPLISHFPSKVPELDDPKLPLMIESDIAYNLVFNIGKKDHCMIYKMELSPPKIALNENILRGDGYTQNAFKLTARVWCSYLMPPKSVRPD